MPEQAPASGFADLARRWLDGGTTASEHERLCELLRTDEGCAREFASIARFDALLKQECRRESRALLEFVALEAESASEEPEKKLAAERNAHAIPLQIASGRVVQPVNARRDYRIPVWLRMAALFVLFAGVVAVWCERPGARKEGSVVADSTPRAQVHRTAKLVAIQPRQQIASAAEAEAALPTDKAVKPLTLERRLNDFFLPAVNLQQTAAGDAAQWLTDQLHAHNYAKRADLDKLAVSVPSAASKRTVTLQSGPISFAKAVEIVAALAQCEALVTDDGINISLSLAPSPVQWMPVPAGIASVADAKQSAGRLGIALSDSAVRADASTNKLMVSMSGGELRALSALTAARSQISSLAPLSFVPLVVPTSGVGGERVLTEAEAAAVRDRLASAPAGSLPVVTLPFTAATDASGGNAALKSSSGGSLSLSVVPVGEMNQVTVTETQTSNLLADNSQQSPPSIDSTVTQTTATTAAATSAANTSTAVQSTSTIDAMLALNQGIVVVIEDGVEVYYTADGIPIPDGAIYISGLAASSSSGSSGSSLLLVPVP